MFCLVYDCPWASFLQNKPAEYLQNATEYSKQVKFMTSKRRQKRTEFVGNKFLDQKYNVVYKIKHIIFFYKVLY